MNQKGSPLSTDIRKSVVKAKRFFDGLKSSYAIKEASTEITASLFEIGIATVHRIMADYHRDETSVERDPVYRGRPSYAIDESHQEAVRSYVRKANQEGKIITLEMIKAHLSKLDADKYVHITTIARTLDRWGFAFGKGKRTQHLKEKDHIIASRRRYLRIMRENRKNINDADLGTVRPEVYLDESYVNKNHSNDFTWYTQEEGPWIQKPTGKGDRLIILNAMTKDGWVKDAKVVFKSTRKTGDYHGQMNANLFQKWFSEKLIPNLPKNALIIMDNAPYHNVLTPSSAPTSRCSKHRIYTWLTQNKAICKEDCLKAELIEILTKLAPEPDYVVDEIARINGHDVVRTPPYHPELQPIEICWAVVKNHIARSGDFSLKALKNNLEEGFFKVTEKTCSKIIHKVRQVENRFWDEDSLSEKNHNLLL